MRKEFLIEKLFEADKVLVTYSHVDKMCAFGCMPVTREVPLDDGIDCYRNFGTIIFWSAARWVFSTSEAR